MTVLVQELETCQQNAPTVNPPTSLVTPATVNAESVAVNGHTMTEMLTAKIKMQMATRYLHDLAEWRNGDDNRFGRMVDGRGAGYSSPALWLRNLANIAANPFVLAAFPDFPDWLTGQVKELNLELPS